MLKNLEFLTFSYFSSSWRIRTALKGRGIERAVQVRRKCVFGCVNSMPGGRFMQVFMIFGGFGELGWILGNYAIIRVLKIFENVSFVSECDRIKRWGIYQKSIEICRRPPPLSGLRRNHPLRRPCPTRKGGPCARGLLNLSRKAPLSVYRAGGR